ncbi:SipW-dependent-type signal peptide-containing protein [Candidatus Woesebacteria bacterium]|nr:SipW-dependent-type signal peptide-containing protein [Candidatus Woesebacteria bacterium]
MKKKKVWLSIALIAVVGGGALVATYAYFTAQRTTSVNKFTTGTLDLDVSANGNKLEPFVIDNIGEEGDISGSKTWTVKNTGTLPGRFLLRLQNVVNEENGCNDQEKAVDPNCEDPGKVGDLGNVITLKVGLDGVDKVESTLATADQSAIGAAWASLPNIILAAGEERTITAHWATGEDDYGNEIQSDSVKFDVNFRLIQKINGPAPDNN